MPPDLAPEATTPLGHAVTSRIRRPGPTSAEAIARWRLGLYTAATAIAFALELGVLRLSANPWFLACGGASVLCLLAGYARRGTPFRAGVLAVLVLALGMPVWPMLAGDPPMAIGPLWPQTLVALFSSRVLSEDCDLRFAQIWRTSGQPGGPAAAQSAAAAVALGACLTLVFYQALDGLGAVHSVQTNFSAIVLNALTGETIVHRAIVALFFVILAYLAESAWTHLRDRTAFRALAAAEAARRSRGERIGGGLLAASAGGPEIDLSDMRAALLVEGAMRRIESQRPAALALRSAAFDAFQHGSRRFVRGLLPFLPMLGFFGTVVGLATAMAALPTSMPDGGSVDISTSLSGLAVKFQTTLLGIMASLVASAILAFIEKGEAELGAACALFAASLEADHGP